MIMIGLFDLLWLWIKVEIFVFVCLAVWIAIIWNQDV